MEAPLLTVIIAQAAVLGRIGQRSPDDADFSHLDALADELPDGMKLILTGPGGALENAISLVGYQDLCLMVLEDPELVGEIFEAIGSRVVRNYELAVGHEAVGAVFGNDDWGFQTQTVLHRLRFM